MTTGFVSGSPGLMFSKGTPTALAPENTVAFDTTTTPYVMYLMKGGSWTKAGGGLGLLAAGAFSTLPAAAAGNQGFRGLITDGNLTAASHFASAVSGGGTNICPVYSDGTSWLIG